MQLSYDMKSFESHLEPPHVLHLIGHLTTSDMSSLPPLISLPPFLSITATIIITVQPGHEVYVLQSMVVTDRMSEEVQCTEGIFSRHLHQV